jgi:hypothetical protein
MMNDNKMFKTYILLGIALGGLKSMYWTLLDDDDGMSVLYESMDGLIKLLENGIDEIFYNDRMSDERITDVSKTSNTGMLERT